MHPDICPTITATNAHIFRQQMERVAPFTKRVHIDLSDGEFSPNKLVDISEVWWPGGIIADIHVMYKRPLRLLPGLIALKPQLVIVQAEAEGDFVELSKSLKENGIEVGLALLPRTEVEVVKPALQYTDHVLIFSGNLGFQGGSHANLELAEKIKPIKDLMPRIEIGWDGGVNYSNARKLVELGVDVLNVGGFIQGAEDPAAQYKSLEERVRGSGV